ncbi:MAG TPA: hypothetical protein ENK46_00815 [Flavobacteriia bacterium]|nr:hypothetical protein [Flavobacteriia bacterium]
MSNGAWQLINIFAKKKMYKKAHWFTGIAVSVFIAFHLFNHLMGWYGIETHQKILEAFRTVYRNIFVEIVLVASFLFQAYSGIRLFLQKRKKKTVSTFEKIQMYSGLLLGLYVIQHIAASIGQRLYFKFDTNFYFASRVVLQSPWKFFFIPYYFIGVTAVGIHIAATHKAKITPAIGPKKALLHFYLITGMSVIIASVILYILMGGRYEIIIPERYNVY